MGIGFGGFFNITCYDKHGRVKWKDGFKNTVVQTGRRYANNTALAASTQIATWYVGLMDGTPTIASSDTASNHAGWTEFSLYDEATRPTFTAVASADQVGNNASKASFAIATTSALGGAFVVSDSGKLGSAGTLWSGASFSANKSTGPSDTITIEYTASVTSS
jgi:hypothetical protein